MKLWQLSPSYTIKFSCLFSQKATLTNDTKDKEYTPHDLPQRQSVQPKETCSIARRAKRMRSEVSPFSHDTAL